MSSKFSKALNITTTNKSKEHIDSSVEEEDIFVLADNLKLNARVRTKIDCVILPFLTLTVFLQLLDKNCLSYAAVFDLKKDTHLVGQQYSWLATIFYLGYLFTEIPVFFILPKVKLGKFMACILFIWGALLMCMAAAKNFAGLATIRFLLGLFEAAIQPTCIILSSLWYTRAEQPLRMAFWSNTLAGVFNGIFAYGIAHWGGSLGTWQYMFLIYGASTVVFSFLVFFFLPDDIQTAWFLNEEEKKCALARTATNQTGIHFGANKMDMSQVLEALKDPKFWLIAVFIIVQNFINAGITNFNTFIIKGFGYSTYKTMLMATPQGGVAMGVCISCAIACLYVKNIRFYLIILTTCVTMTGIIMIYRISSKTHLHACLAAVYICGFYNAPYVLTLSLVSSNTSGMTKKAFLSISVSLLYALGNVIGPQFFLTSQAPTYPEGIKAMLSACVIMIVCIIGYAGLCLYENKKRDRKQLENEAAAAAGEVIEAIQIGEEVEKMDLTDVQNQHFRYTF